jgi:hypothetical protein
MVVKLGGNGSLAARRRARVARRDGALIRRASRCSAYTARAKPNSAGCGAAEPQPVTIKRKNRYTITRGLSNVRTADYALDGIPGLGRAAFCGIFVLRSRRSPALHSTHVDDG